MTPRTTEISEKAEPVKLFAGLDAHDRMSAPPTYNAEGLHSNGFIAVILLRYLYIYYNYIVSATCQYAQSFLIMLTS